VAGRKFLIGGLVMTFLFLVVIIVGWALVGSVLKDLIEEGQ